MSGFKFRLNTVLYVKGTKKKQAVLDYEEISKLLEIQENTLCDLEKKSDHISELMMSEAAKGIKAANLKTHASFLRRIGTDIKNQSRTVAETKSEKDNMQTVLVKLHNEIEILDDLRHRQYLSFLYDQNRQEEKKTDEFLSYTLSVRSE